MRLQKSKKAQIFAVFIVLTFLVAGGYIIFLAIKGKADFSFNLQSPAKINEMNNDVDKFTIYAKESAKISIAQAYYEIGNSYLNTNCLYDPLNKEYIYLNGEGCEFSEDVYDRFSSSIKENLKRLVGEYPDARFKGVDYDVKLEEGIVNFKTDKKEISATERDYSANYSFDPSFSIKLEDIGLTEFRMLYNALKECKTINEARVYTEEELREVEVCAKSKIQYSKVIITDNNEKIMFNIESKGFFLEDDIGNAEYKPIIFHLIVLK